LIPSKRRPGIEPDQRGEITRLGVQFGRACSKGREGQSRDFPPFSFPAFAWESSTLPGFSNECLPDDVSDSSGKEAITIADGRADEGAERTPSFSDIAT
jgi:hypothetical protein